MTHRPTPEVPVTTPRPRSPPKYAGSSRQARTVRRAHLTAGSPSPFDCMRRWLPMFEKLLSLLLHAKGGALASVLVLGASGALVTATVENGNATITITQPSSGAGGNPVAPAAATTAS